MPYDGMEPYLVSQLSEEEHTEPSEDEMRIAAFEQSLANALNSSPETVSVESEPKLEKEDDKTKQWLARWARR